MPYHLAQKLSNFLYAKCTYYFYQIDALKLSQVAWPRCKIKYICEIKSTLSSITVALMHYLILQAKFLKQREVEVQSPILSKVDSVYHSLLAHCLTLVCYANSCNMSQSSVQKFSEMCIGYPMKLILPKVTIDMTVEITDFPHNFRDFQRENHTFIKSLRELAVPEKIILHEKILKIGEYDCSIASLYTLEITIPRKLCDFVGRCNFVN